MAETGLSRKGKKSFFEEITLLRLLRFVFFLFLSILVVYIYYLHLTGNLQKTILEIWTKHQKVMISSSIFLVYSTVIFQIGVWRGRRR